NSRPRGNRYARWLITWNCANTGNAWFCKIDSSTAWCGTAANVGLLRIDRRRLWFVGDLRPLLVFEFGIIESGVVLFEFVVHQTQIHHRSVQHLSHRKILLGAILPSGLR